MSWVPWKAHDPRPSDTRLTTVHRNCKITYQLVRPSRYGKDKVIAYWSEPLPPHYAPQKENSGGN